MNWILRVLEAATLIMSILYLIDYELDGDLDLPHYLLKKKRKQK